MQKQAARGQAAAAAERRNSSSRKHSLGGRGGRQNPEAQTGTHEKGGRGERGEKSSAAAAAVEEVDEMHAKAGTKHAMRVGEGRDMQMKRGGDVKIGG